MIDPSTMTHDALIAHRDREWEHSANDSEFMQTICASMRDMSPEEYREYLIRGLEQQPDRRKIW